MLRYEWPTLIGLGGCVACQFFRNIFIRYLPIYGVGVLAIYSYIHYKTPWCIINLAWPFLFVFGAVIVLIPLTYRILSLVPIGIVLAYSLGYCVWLNYFRCTTDTEPYVYVQ